jgi:glycosyltransferase involved in cell wall biosynthesis
MDILIIYQFCTFGGVERAVLNRAKTFKKYQQNVRLSIGYLQDHGALSSFQTYIHTNQLNDCLSAFLITADTWQNLDQYDIVLNIDTPQIFEHTLRASNVFVECHTPYIENRQYLKSLPQNIKGLIVPSEAFKTLVVSEFRQLPPIFVLPNPVPEEFFNIPFAPNERIFSKSPLAYLARLDELKNFAEAQRIFNLFAKNEKVMFAVVGRGAEDIALINKLISQKILDKTFFRDQIDFDAVPAFIQMVKNHQGVFISPSKGESFGLSAAEFISAGVPVLLSDIAPHKELVNGDEMFTYPLGNIFAAKVKILNILMHWEDASNTMKSYGKKFQGDSFINAWQSIVNARK